MYAIRSYYDVHVAAGHLEDARHGDQDLVPLLMAVGVVEFLKIVDIDHDQAQGALVPDRPLDLFVQFFRITSYNVCYTKLLRRNPSAFFEEPVTENRMVESKPRI